MQITGGRCVLSNLVFVSYQHNSCELQVGSPAPRRHAYTHLLDGREIESRSYLVNEGQAGLASAGFICCMGSPRSVGSTQWEAVVKQARFF